jgi:hypothetical protein
MIQDKSIQRQYASAKSRLNKLTGEVKSVRNHQQHTAFIQKIVTLENYIFSKIERFYPDDASVLLSAIKELRLDAQHFLDLGVSYREYLASKTEDCSPQHIKQYKKELKLAATLAGY